MSNLQENKPRSQLIEVCSILKYKTEIPLAGWQQQFASPQQPVPPDMHTDSKSDATNHLTFGPALLQQ